MNKKPYLMRLLQVLLAATVLLSGCNKREGSEYAWINYCDRQVYDVKMVVTNTGTIEGKAIIRKDGKVSIEGQDYFKVTLSYDGIPGAEPATSYLRVEDDGVYSRLSTDPKEMRNLEIPIPPTIGKKWSTTREEMILDQQVVSIETVDTATNSYENCLKVSASGTMGGKPVTGTIYYAPKLGMLKTMIQGDGLSIEYRLVDD